MKERPGSSQHGIAAGLTPKYENPANMMLESYGQELRYISGHSIWREIKATPGHAKFVRVGTMPPPGWIKYADNIANVSHYAPKEGGVVQHGAYYGPEAAATIFNNFVRPGFGDNIIFRDFRTAVDKIKAWQLAFSAFHYQFVTLAKSFIDTGTGLSHAAGAVLHGDLPEAGKGLAQVARGATGLVRAASGAYTREGREMRAALRTPGIAAQYQSGVRPQVAALSFLGMGPVKREFELSPAQQRLNEYAREGIPSVITRQAAAHAKQRRDLLLKAHQGDWRGFVRGANALRRSGEFTDRQASELIREGRMKPGEPAFKRLKLDEAFDVYRLGNEQEKRWWWRALIEKWDRASPSQRKQYIGEFRDAIASHKKARSSLPAALAPGASSGLPAALAP